MSWNQELKQIRRELNRGIHNKDVARGDDVTFIEYTKIQEVWAGDRLDRFLRDPTCDPDHGTDKAISNSQIEEARAGLLRMISLLIRIFWEDWSRFKEIFFLYPRATIERRDHAIKDLKKNELEHASFLGDPDFVHQFLQERWIYTPLILNADKNALLEDYPRGTRLPLVRQEDCEPPRGGGFGVVTKEKILPGHIFLRQPGSNLGVSDQVNSTELIVARKRFTNGRSEVEYRQLEFLQSSLCSHERIVYPLATVKIDNTLNIIMPWADMDLDQYIHDGYKLMKPGNLLLQDIIGQSVELAAALEFLHGGLQGKVHWPKLPQQGVCHGDFTPKNILIFNHRQSVTGDWAITDFGVSQQAFRSLTTGRHGPGLSSTNHSLFPPLGGIYQAPEIHAQLRSDIWSFGCILVQLFALGIEHGDPYSGYRASTSSHEAFRWQNIRERFCVQIQGAGFILNSNVDRWIQSLKVQYCNLYNVEILSKMQDLLFSMLKIDFHDRAHAAEVRGRLYEIHRMAIEQGLGPLTDSVPTTSPPPILPRPLTVTSPSIPTPPTTPSGSIRRPSAQLPDQSQISFLVNNIKTGNIDNVKHCLQLQPDVDIERVDGTDRPLIHAIEQGSVAMISALWEHKPNLDVNTPSSQNVTPLYLAVTKGDLGMVKILIDILEQSNSMGALDQISSNGRTPLMEAASGKSVAVVSELLNRGADTTICVGEEQKNCLHFAVENIKAQEDLIKAFVGKMDFNMTPGTYGYETPMMRHISLGVHERYGASSVSQLWKNKFFALRDGNADVNLKYGTGKIPLQLALEKGKFEIANILQAQEADAELPPGEEMPWDKTKNSGNIFNRIGRLGKRISGR